MSGILLWLQSRLVELLLVLAVLALVYVNGCQQGQKLSDAKAEQAAAALNDEHQRALLGQIAYGRKELARAEQASRQLLSEQGKTRVVYRTIRQEVPHVIHDHPSLSNTAALAADCSLGADLVSLWNRALDPLGAVAQPAAGDPAAAAGNAAAAEAFGLEQLLGNHIDNAELCTTTRQQLNALIDYELAEPTLP